ncbi:PREDICTED: alpha-1-macroglobulin-like [Dipodomys ordii]|uniref:Alpha-1-macroglobulin-like n=1 Tax=Dipodomys ordii TaxID=10020 RepID=A0A1S3FR39_DIPOR|nr:PREDICTED: alpha-1-macroglobulin-like [Dipodomys ordii]
MAVNPTESRIPETRLFSSCPGDWIGFGNKCYYFSDNVTNWTSSQAFCASFDANLVKFDSKEELNFLERHRDSYDRWIGLRRESPQHSWKWADNTEFSNLAEVRGTGECAYLNGVGISSGRFYTERKWICSKPSSYVQCAATSGSLMHGATYKQNSHVCFDSFLDEVHQQAQHVVKNVISSSKSYVHLELVLGTLSCGQSQEMWAHSILNEQILKDEQELTFYYLLLLYAVLPNGEVVANVQKVHIEHGFTNQVTATLLSFCALRAVDQSMLLLKPEKELSPQAISPLLSFAPVYNLLPTKTPVKSHVDAGVNKDCIYAEDIIHNGLIYSPKQDPDDEDIHSILLFLALSLPYAMVRGEAFALRAAAHSYLPHCTWNLLQLPHGCGEQNMILFVPNIHVLNYRNVTQQLTEEIKSKATSYLVSGYQTQLNYKHRDGSDSTFGDQDVRTPGNTCYTGERPSSNMIIVDVKMASSFVPERISVKQLQNRADIQRTEVSTNHVLIYLEKLTREVVSFSFSVEQDVEVKNLQPATVKAYDYYKTDEYAIEEYSIPCRAAKKL